MTEPEYVEVEEERPGREILEYLEVPFRYPRALFIPFALILSFALLLGPIVPRKFRSGTLILVESKNLPEYFVVPMTSEGISQRLGSIRQLVLSRTNLEKVIQKLNPYPEMVAVPSHVVVETMRRAIEIRVQGSDSFVIEYVNRDPQKAMDITNLLASQFIDDAGRLRDGLTRKTFNFLQTNLQDARKALEERESALRLNKQRFWGALPEQLEANLRVLQQLQVEQQTLGGNLKTLEDRRATLERSLLEGRRLAAAGRTAGPVAELAKQRAAYASLLGRYTEDHPDMQALRARIEELERQTLAAQQLQDAEPKDPDLGDPQLASLDHSLGLVESEIDSLKQRRDALDARIADFQARVERTPKAEQELASLTRDYEQLRENYGGALRKEMDAEMARRLEEYWRGGYFRVIDPAYLPRRPIRPYAFLFLVGGFFFGAGAGLASAFIADILDRSVKTERDLEELVPYPVLLTIPRATMPRGRVATA